MYRIKIQQPLVIFFTGTLIENADPHKNHRDGESAIPVIILMRNTSRADGDEWEWWIFIKSGEE